MSGRAPVILLNGTSSAGKTTLARALVARLRAFRYLGVDDVVDRHPDRSRLASLSRRPDGGLRLTLTPEGRWLMRGFHRAAAGLVAAGQPLVIDDMVFERWLLADWAAVLPAGDVLFVGMHCSLDELERRERDRPERDPGLARGHLQLVHAHARYDVEVHSDRADVDACASLVLSHWSAGTPPRGLSQVAATVPR